MPVLTAWDQTSLGLSVCFSSPPPSCLYGAVVDGPVSLGRIGTPWEKVRVLQTETESVGERWTGIFFFSFFFKEVAHVAMGGATDLNSTGQAGRARRH